uniref:Cytochrome c oxidase subunit 2 n=1 Tax=Cerceris quinquefasciata TaxID=2026451 RepID=A0A8B0JP38_9HYME|nr:cytochrome c oxidase subunit II [Cerceris quinquefasciata]QTV22614.1 cytochrome c oxidase subunit II [Cerceris quinquefasciata]
MCIWKMMNLQYSNSILAYFSNYIYEFVMIIIVMIFMIILYLYLSILINKYTNRFLLHGNTIEIIWTITPMIILFMIAIPSLKLLYMTDDYILPMNLTIKIIGHQWYWSYEYPDFNNFEFNSYMIFKSINKNWFRLLDVDNNMIIPIFTPTRILISSTDVIHSWTVPSLAIKIDAIPGRINQNWIMTLRYGQFFGQCSEICGINHSFMPIVLESTNNLNFMKWINKMNK